MNSLPVTCEVSMFSIDTSAEFQQIKISEAIDISASISKHCIIIFLKQLYPANYLDKNPERFKPYIHTQTCKPQHDKHHKASRCDRNRRQQQRPFTIQNRGFHCTELQRIQCCGGHRGLCLLAMSVTDQQISFITPGSRISAVTLWTTGTGLCLSAMVGGMEWKNIKSFN